MQHAKQAAGYSTSACDYPVKILFVGIGEFGVKNVALWHVSGARKALHINIHEQFSRVQSLDGGAAGAFGWHACRQPPTCSARLVTFPERRYIILKEQRKLRSGRFM